MARTVRPSRNKYMSGLITMSIDQAANMGNADHIEFDTDEGDFIVSTGVGQANGKITLPGGHRYLIRMALLCRATAGNFTGVNYAIYDVTNAALLAFQGQGSSQSTNFDTTYAQQPAICGEVYVSSTIEIEFRITNTPPTIHSIRKDFSFAQIQEIPR